MSFFFFFIFKNNKIFWSLLFAGITFFDLYLFANFYDLRKEDDLRTRFIQTISDSGPLYVLVDMSLIAAFFLSAPSSTPAIRSFAMFAGFSVVFEFIYKLLFIQPFLAIDVYRTQVCINFLFFLKKTSFTK